MPWYRCLTGLFGLAMTTGMAPAHGQTLPAPLMEAATEKGCTELSDFFKRPGLVEPPYVIGYLPGDRESSAAFWCTRPKAEEKYLLVIVGQKNKCPAAISWKNYPGGLSVIRGGKMKLSDFFYRDNVREIGPPDSHTKGPILRSEYDGTGAHFYCHEGRWLVQQFH
jgi:hypothetical protein